jgi:hypothetical protein
VATFDEAKGSMKGSMVDSLMTTLGLSAVAAK